MQNQNVLTVLTQVCSAFFERLERPKLIGRILESAIQLTHSERGTVFLAPDGVSNITYLTSLIATGMGDKEIRVDVNHGIAGHVFKTNLPLVLNDAQSDPRFNSKVDENTGFITRSILAVPLRSISGRTLGVIEILNSKKGKFQEEEIQVLQVLSLFAAVALEQRNTIDSLTETNERLNQVRWDLLEKLEKDALRTSNRELQEIYDKLEIFALSDSSVLLEGESGTGKEMIAQMVHMKSKRKDKPFVALNCAAIPESLFEAELFGVARGAATGTIARKGKIEVANGGTLFLDEVGELPLSAQAKLLRVLQERTVTRVGSDEQPRPVDFRVVAATNRDLAAMVKGGTFREDLFYRINVVRFRLPPLRERLHDIPGLCHAIIQNLINKRAWKPKQMSDACLKHLMSYEWPGNIRQLQNKIESAMILSADRKVLEPSDFKLETHQSAPDVMNSHPISGGAQILPFKLRAAKNALEKGLIERVLAESGGNKTEAARRLGISREGLRKAMMRFKKAA